MQWAVKREVGKSSTRNFESFNKSLTSLVLLAVPFPLRPSTSLVFKVLLRSPHSTSKLSFFLVVAWNPSKFNKFNNLRDPCQLYPMACLFKYFNISPVLVLISLKANMNYSVKFPCHIKTEWFDYDEVFYKWNKVNDANVSFFHSIRREPNKQKASEKLFCCFLLNFISH